MRAKYSGFGVVAASILLGACGALDGPSDSVVEEFARQGTLHGSMGPEWAEAAKSGTFSKRGMCNTQAEPGNYVCMVDASGTLPGQAQETTQTVVVKVTQSPDGNWVVAE